LELRGKGYALEHAFNSLLAEDTTDGVVVVDADTDVTSNILRAIAKRLTEGELAMQAHYGVRNVEDSWRTRLLDLAFTLYHGVRSSARERLNLSAGLRGNGMGFALETLRRVPHKSYSLVEDVEYGVQLGLHGIRVAYVGEAEVRGEMVAKSKGSESQRRRWEFGRYKLVREYVPLLLLRALKERNAVLLDLGLDLLTPPLANLFLYTAAGSSIAVLLGATRWCQPVALIPWGIAVAGISVYLGRGIQMSSQGPKALLSLLHAPKYAAWKIGLRLAGTSRQTREWVRTSRAGEEGIDDR
jgi:cellulose synthase/poly-beta-1,6-N-acetylglucosamine synthase-like glycosyltransferase